MFFNKQKNNNRLNALANSLSNSRLNYDNEYQPLRLSGSISEEQEPINSNDNFSNILNTGGKIYNSYKSGGLSGGNLSSVPWSAIGSGLKGAYNSGFGTGDADYTDTEETIAYPLQGASMGAQFGPWGALGGALYGLGYSFKDDLGLDDNEWYTDLIFPIGMGDEHEGIFQL